MPLTPEQRRRLLRIRRATEDRPDAVLDCSLNASVREIADVLGVGKSTVQRIIDEVGRPTPIAAQEDR